jgi:DNA polymerase-3 subunit gamma/tau
MAEDFKNYYRPIDFKQVIGQDEAVATLRGSLKKGKVYNTLLLEGPFGTGKTTLGRIYAKHLCCTNYDAKNLKPCGECPSCKAFGKNNNVDNHMSVQEINCADNNSVDFARQFCVDARRKAIGKRKVYILDEAQRLTKQAQECLLKLFEEPPKSTVIIICTTDAQMLIPTIHSRLTKVHLNAVTPEDCLKFLKRICKKEEKEVNDKILEKISNSCNGHLRDAASMLENVIDALEDNRELSVKDLMSVVEKSSIANPYELAGKLLQSLYSGNYSSLKFLTEMDDNSLYQIFTSSIPEQHTEVLYSAIDFDSMALKTKDNWKFRKIDTFIKDYVNNTLEKKTKALFVEHLSTMAEDLIKLVERLNMVGSSNKPRFLITSFVVNQAKKFRQCKPPKK